jgi:ATPase family associated with various cellular activities (AAA)
MISAYKWNQGIVDEIEHSDELRIGGQYSGKVSRTILTPYHLALCSPMVHGYSLKLKKWLGFYVDLVSEITWDIDPLRKLILPDTQKELIIALAESKIETRNNAFDDIIRGKGKGFVMLLSGPPGVGKTLTAEALAESMRVPLHKLSSGDLGSSSGEIQRELSRTLELVAHWNAILLIDECDVFLEARSTHDLERNKIVSIFLHHLEYYEGILFLTSNRIENIDLAFESRIHVSIEYSNHLPEWRYQIWRNFFNSTSQPHEISEGDLEDLSKKNIEWAKNQEYPQDSTTSRQQKSDAADNRAPRYSDCARDDETVYEKIDVTINPSGR